MSRQGAIFVNELISQDGPIMEWSNMSVMGAIDGGWSSWSSWSSPTQATAHNPQHH